jgi:hypothetical protein
MSKAECPPGWAFLCGRWMNLDTGEVAPRLTCRCACDGYGDFDDRVDIESEVALDMTKEQCEQFAMDLAKAVEGKWIHARVVQGYVNDSIYEVEGDFLVRICRPSCEGDILRWTTYEHLDPYWDFSVCYPWPVTRMRTIPLGSPFMYGVTVRRVDQT